MKELLTLKNALLLVAVAIVALFATLYPREKPGEAYTNDPALLTFSNTMEWDRYYENLSEGEAYYFKDWRERIELAPPPSNTSEETAAELAELAADKELRTPAKLAEIREEISLDGMRLAGLSITQYLDKQEHPKTAALFTQSFQDITIITLGLKKHFDRVRPHILEPSLAPVISVPGHPAYPSGHSTQAHFFAEVLSALVPEQREELFAEAARIARNREIAGLHYPSDSRAGAELARQYFALLLTNKEFSLLLEEARSEW